MYIVIFPFLYILIVSLTYNDLDFLYDSINYLIRGDGESIQEYMMQNHLYSFLYELRHAYQGQRGAELIDNDLNEYTKKYYQIKNNTILISNYENGNYKEKYQIKSINDERLSIVDLDTNKKINFVKRS